MKYTPGPWDNHPDESDPAMHRIKSDDYGTIAVVHEDRVVATETGRLDELAANARLIAAAPEMLRALHLARKIFVLWVDEGHVAVRRIDEAIAKATGSGE